MLANLLKTTGVLVIIGLSWFLWSSWTGMTASASMDYTPTIEASHPDVSDNTDFNGKILVLRLDGPVLRAIEQAKVRKLGNRLFLVGKGVDVPYGKWAKGRTMWFAIELIAELIVFESVEQAKKAVPPEYSDYPRPSSNEAPGSDQPPLPFPLPYTRPIQSH